MLVETMDNKEVSAEIKKDFEKLAETTMQRLIGEYERERKRLQIKKERTYTRIYPIKSARKNNWLFFIRKGPSKDVCKHRDDIEITPVVYYHNKKGLRVFSCADKNLLGVYKGHFFKRYNERLRLGLPTTLDIIKHYFTYNCYTAYKAIEKGGRVFTIGFGKDGLVLGEGWKNELWLVNNTFISKDLFFPEQSEAEKAMFVQLQSEIENTFIMSEKDELKLRVWKSRLRTMSGMSMD
jgi:hypothetical protein